MAGRIGLLVVSLLFAGCLGDSGPAAEPEASQERASRTADGPLPSVLLKTHERTGTITLGVHIPPATGTPTEGAPLDSPILIEVPPEADSLLIELVSDGGLTDTVLTPRAIASDGWYFYGAPGQGTAADPGRLPLEDARPSYEFLPVPVDDHVAALQEYTITISVFSGPLPPDHSAVTDAQA